MNKHFKIYRTLLFFICVFVLSCIGKENGNKNTEIEPPKSNQSVVILSKQQYDAIGIVTGTFFKKNLSDIIKLNGLLEIPPKYRAKVTAMINGSVTKILVKQGDMIRQGDTLAFISHPDIIQLQQDFLEAQSQLAFSERDYLRQKELIKENATAAINFEKTESDYYSQKYRFLALEKKLKLINIESSEVAGGLIFNEAPVVTPIIGFVNFVNINIGSSVAANEDLFEISDNEKIQAALLVYEKDISKIKIGQSIQITLTSDLSRTFAGNIFSISRSFEKDVNAIKIYADIKGKINGLLHGSNIEARLEVISNTVDALPDEALIREGENTYIFIMSDKIRNNGDFVFKRIPVKTGISDLGYTEVTPLITLGNISNIVLKGAYELNAKMKSSETDED